MLKVEPKAYIATWARWEGQGSHSDSHTVHLENACCPISQQAVGYCTGSAFSSFVVSGSSTHAPDWTGVPQEGSKCSKRMSQ